MVGYFTNHALNIDILFKTNEVLLVLNLTGHCI